MGYQFREIRRHDLAEALAFASEHGLSIDKAKVRHTMSLLVKREGQAVATALCVETEPGHFAMRFAVALDEEADNEALSQELADRSLRKMQASGIGAASVSSAEPTIEDSLFARTNWLEQIKEVCPPKAESDAVDAAMAIAQPV